MTQYDLAEHLGIGQKTVSRALAGGSNVAPQLLARIQAAAAELGYRPNQSARSTKTRRFDTAMLVQVVAKSHHRLAPGIVDGIADRLGEAGRPLLIERLVLEDFAVTGAVPRALRQAIVDGLLVHVDAEPPARVDELILRSGLPVVWVNRQRPGDAVCPDDEAAAVMLVERFTAAGHRRIAWFDQQLGFRNPADLHHSRRMREDGYRKAMHTAGLQADVMTPLYDPGESGHLAWLESRLRSDPPTAIACYSSYEVHAAVFVAGRLGISIPTDLSLAAVHHESLMSGIRVDVAALPTAELGRAAATMLVELMTGHASHPSVRVGFRVIPGATIVPPARP